MCRKGFQAWAAANFLQLCGIGPVCGVLNVHDMLDKVTHLLDGVGGPWAGWPCR